MSSNKSISAMQKELYREELLRLHDQNRGGKFQSFNIEPTPWDRNRTAPEYSDADRMLRKQWLQDQCLSAREPVTVPEFERVNVFRNLWRKPWEAMYSALKPILGHTNSWFVRTYVPKVTAGVLVSWVVWYHLKYDPNTWSTGTKSSYIYQLDR